jgi:hypothetical protein
VRLQGSFVSRAIALSATLVFIGMRPAQAMPPFAQAYGESCEVCHSAVPALNAYGRYVQRTGYSSLDPATIHRAIPLWIGENPFLDSQDPVFPHKIQAGNFALHAVGYLGTNWTFHAQQWITQANQSGGTDTLWLTYNNLLHRDGHLFIGKLQAPAPSPYNQWFELSGFAPPAITVGEHGYLIGGTRWGTKLSYTHDWLLAEAAYLGTDGNLNTATDFSDDTDKSVDWRLAYGRPDKPMEFGVFGTTGTLPISNGTFDHYNATSVYGEVDSEGVLPGLFAVYQVGHDPNPGPGLGAASSKAFSVDMYHPFFNQRVMLGLRQEYTDDGLGTTGHSSNADFEWLAVREVGDRNATGLIANAEAAMAPGVGPDWKYQLWYVTTVGPLH